MYGGIWHIRIKNVAPCVLVPIIFTVVVIARWALLAHASSIKGLVPAKLEDVITANVEAMRSFSMRFSTPGRHRKRNAAADGDNGHSVSGHHLHLVDSNLYLIDAMPSSLTEPLPNEQAQLEQHNSSWPESSNSQSSLVRRTSPWV